jgi:hypothetical protein
MAPVIGRTSDGLKMMASAVATFIATGFVISFFTGAPFIAGFWGGLDQFTAWLILIAAVTIFGYFTDDVSIGFVFTFIAILALGSMFLPGWATRPFSFISEALFDTPSLGIDPVEFAVLSIVGVIAFWAVRAKLFGRPETAGAVANRVRSKSESLVREYAKILAIIGGFVVTAFFLFASESLAGPLGELFTAVAGAPVVGAYVASIVGYFGAFMSDWPVISSFGTTEFFLILVALGIVAFGAKYSSALDN